MMAKPKILIGVPVYHAVQPRPFMSFLSLAKQCAADEAQSKYAVRWAVPGPKVKTVVARNSLTDMAVQFGADYILFLDDDVIVPRDIVSMLLEDNKDVVGGLCFRSGTPIEPLAFKYYDETDEYIPYFGYPKESLFEVDAVGTGAMMIRTSILGSLKRPYWIGSIDPMYGEDVNFCKKAKDAGFSIWCDSRIKVQQMSVPIPIGELQYNMITEGFRHE